MWACLFFAYLSSPPRARVPYKYSYTTRSAVIRTATGMHDPTCCCCCCCLTCPPPQYITASQFQVFNNGKIVITAFVFRSFLGRKLKMYQWFCVLMLGMGMCVTALPGPGDVVAETSEARRHAPIVVQQL